MNIRKKATQNENENTRNDNNIKIIKKIRINKIFIYFCFFLVKRRNNIESALLKEGIKLYIDKMDVINIFKNLALIDENKNGNRIIEMNDSCKDIINKFVI
jgi:hypothetical protein